MKIPLLELRDLSMHFGGIRALDRVNLELHAGELVGVIGPNGAGKTTLFNVVTGVYQPTSGQVLFRGEDLAGLSPHEIARYGIARTFQNIRLFKRMSVLDNVRVGEHHRVAIGVASSIVLRQSHRPAESAMAERAYRLLQRFGLAERAFSPAGHLPYGAQRRLEIARALASGPQVLLLDEPAAGMNRSEIAELRELIRDVHREFELAILLIEHQMPLVMELCERIYVLDFGKVIAHGTPAEIQRDPKVIEAYLGREEDSPLFLSEE